MAFFGLTSKSSANKERKKAKFLKGELERTRRSQEEEVPNITPMHEAAKTHAKELHTIEKAGLQAGREQGEEFGKRQFQGYTPEERNREEAMAARATQKKIQKAERDIIGKGGHHGRRGGSVYAQKADLERMGLESHNEAQDAIRRADKELALKNEARQFAIEQGGGTGAIERHQQALNELNLAKEKKKQRRYEDQLFSRIRG